MSEQFERFGEIVDALENAAVVGLVSHEDALEATGAAVAWLRGHRGVLVEDLETATWVFQQAGLTPPWPVPQ